MCFEFFFVDTFDIVVFMIYSIDLALSISSLLQDDKCGGWIIRYGAGEAGAVVSCCLMMR